MEIQESVSLVCHADRTRLLEVFRSAIAKPLPASQTAVATMVDAVKPQKQTILVQDENQLLENGLRTLLEELVSAAVENNKSVMQYGRAEGGEDDDGNGLLTRLLDIVLFLCEKGNVEGGMIFQLLEDLTEVSTIKDCKEVFGYIEGKQETLGKSELFSRGKLVMLRTCNQLLRRLSKTNDVVFCGRILMFLAHFFPLSERSAVNIKGVFNTSNETKYEKEAPGDGVAIDFTFYKTFWSLQEYFSSPTSLTHPSKWQAFSTNLSSVLEAFEVQPLGEEDESFSLDGDDDDSSFNIKYLTSSNLMSLELKDPGFRRHVLVQCLIIFDYLKTPGKAEKDGPREVIREELKVHEERVKKLLRTTPPKGKEFLASIEHILERDKNWVWWKRDGCTPFERFVQEKKSPSEPAKRKFRWRLGNRELSRLWKWSEDNPNAITDAKRAKMTPLAEYFKPLAEDLDPEAGIEDEYHHKNNKVYCWKGLRFAARQDLEALSRYSDLKIMGVVPPELLTAEVRSSLYKTSDRLRAKGLKKDEEYTPSRAQIEDATGNSTTDVSLMEVESTTPAQDTEEATAMEAEGLVVAEVEPEPEAEAEAEAETETEAEPNPELVVEPAEEAETEVDVDVDVDAEADADVNVEAEADTDVGAEAKPEAEAEGKAELVQTETKPGAEGDAEAVETEAMETEAMETEAKPGAEGIAEPGQTEALPGAEGNSEPMQTEEKEPPSPKVVTEPPKTPKSQTRSGKKRPHPDE